MEKIKIASVIDTIETDSAGTEKQLLTQVKKLDRSRYDITIVCLRDSPWLRDTGLDCDSAILHVRNLFGLSCISGLSRFVKLYRQKKFDIVQTFFIDGNIFGTIAARLAGCRTVISNRRGLGNWDRIGFRILFRILRRWTALYITNSRATARNIENIEKVKPEKINIIYNGMEIDRFKDIPQNLRREQRDRWGIQDGELLIGNIANIRHEKNIESLVDAARKLRNEFGNLKFAVVGEGPERAKIKNLVTANKMDDYFLLPGGYPDVLPCLAAFDIAVLCSKSESFSNSLIEYMAAGLPIVASDVGGNPEAITHEKTGLLYNVDDISGLTDSLRILITDNQLSRRLGGKARETALETYSWEKTMNLYDNLYSGLVAARG